MEEKKKNFYEKFIQPLQKEYIILGALIIFLTFLKDIFDGELLFSFLAGTLLFGISMILLELMFKTTIFQITKKSGPLEMFYFLILPLFVTCFFILAFNKYPSFFNVFLGIFSSLIFLVFLVDLRLIFVILNKKIKIKYSVLQFISKKGLIILFIFIILLINTFVVQISSGSLKIDSLKYEGGLTLNNIQFFLISFMGLYGIMIILVLFVSIIDLFKKEPKWSEGLKWENLWTVSYLKKLSSFYKQQKEAIIPHNP